MTLTTQLFFDDFSTAEGDVTPKITTLLSWTHPTQASRDRDRPCPPLVAFRWGGNSTLDDFSGYLKSVVVNYTVFRKDGTPVQAKVDITIEGQPETIGGQNPTSHSINSRRVHTMIEGDTLQSIAFRELGKAAYWRAIAELNGIDDPHARARPARSSSSRPSPTRRGAPEADPMPVPPPPSSASSRSTAAALAADVEGQLESVARRGPAGDAGHVHPGVPGPGAGHPGQRRASRSGRRSTISTTSARSDAPAALIDGRGHLDRGGLRHAGGPGGRARLRPESHRLAAGRRTETYQNATYSDVAQKIAQGRRPPGGRRRRPAGPTTTSSRPTSRTSSSCTASPGGSASTVAWRPGSCCSSGRSSRPRHPAWSRWSGT